MNKFKLLYVFICCDGLIFLKKLYMLYLYYTNVKIKKERMCFYENHSFG